MGTYVSGCCDNIYKLEIGMHTNIGTLIFDKREANHLQQMQQSNNN